MALTNECTSVLFSGKTPAQLLDEVRRPLSNGAVEVTPLEACRLTALADHYKARLRAPSRDAIRFSSSADEARELVALETIERYRGTASQYQPRPSSLQGTAMASAGDWGVSILVGLGLAALAAGAAFFMCECGGDDPQCPPKVLPWNKR